MNNLLLQQHQCDDHEEITSRILNNNIPSSSSLPAIILPLATLFIVVVMATSNMNYDVIFKFICLLCPPMITANDDGNDSSTNGEVEEEDILIDMISSNNNMISSNNNRAIFRRLVQDQKTPNDSFETGLTGTSFEDEEGDGADGKNHPDYRFHEEESGGIRNIQNKQIDTELQKQPNESTPKTNLSTPTSMARTEETDRRRGCCRQPSQPMKKVLDTEQVENCNTFDFDTDDDDDGFYSIYCSGKKYECDHDDRSDASEITMPSFRLRSRNKKNQGTKSSFTKLAKRTVQKAFRASMLSILGKKDKHNATIRSTEQHTKDASSPSMRMIPCCSCLILLMEPSSHTFEIIPVAYYPGESSVADLLEQIPLLSTFNFRLRFQNYTGLLTLLSPNNINNKMMEGCDTKQPTCHQLIQSKPVPIKYSCEYHHLKQLQEKEAAAEDTTPISTTMMPLVAILPEKTIVVGGADGRNSKSVNIIDITERLARKLLSDPSVTERIKFLQSIMIQCPKVHEDDENDNDGCDDDV
jgi:hypothetical protein